MVAPLEYVYALRTYILKCVNKGCIIQIWGSPVVRVAKLIAEMGYARLQ